MKHVRHHATPGILATNVRRCIHNHKRLSRMYTQWSEKDANATSQTLLSQWPIRAYRHRLFQSFAEDDKRQSFGGNHDQSIVQAHTNNANIENKRDAYRDHLLRQQDRTIRDTRLLTTDNDTQIERKFLETICSFPGLKHPTTTAYHPQTNEQPE